LQNIVLETGKMKENNGMNEGKTTIRFSDCGENVNAVSQDVLLYPNPTPNKKRRKEDNLLSVLTSDQWIHIAEAKEKERQRKEENRAKKLEKQTKKRTKEVVDLLHPAEVVQIGKERAKCRAMEKSGAH
jgi:hypothetical protein